MPTMIELERKFALGEGGLDGLRAKLDRAGAVTWPAACGGGSL